jgi:hypothetical protein
MPLKWEEDSMKRYRHAPERELMDAAIPDSCRLVVELPEQIDDLVLSSYRLLAVA